MRTWLGSTVCLAVLSCATLPACAQACLIRLAYNEIAAPPYYYGDAGVTPANPGPAVELVDLAAKHLGCKIQWERKPLKRIIRELEYNAVDATIALSFNKARTMFCVYPLKDAQPDARLALWSLSYDFYVKQGSTLRWDGKQFNHHPTRVGANAGYSVIGDLSRLGITAEEAPGDINNLEKLINGRIDAYAGQSLFVDQLRERAQYQGIEKLTPPITRKDYFLVFSHGFYREHAETVQALWQLIPEMKKVHGSALNQKYQSLMGNTPPAF